MPLTPPTQDPPTPPSWREALPRLALRAVSVLAIAGLAVLAMDLVMRWTESLPSAEARGARTAILVGAIVVYALLMSLPFVPGIEIGITLMIIEGPDFAPIFYAATFGGLALSFAAGRFLPTGALRQLFLDLHLVRAAAMVEAVAPLAPPARLHYLQSRLPGRLGRWLLTYRYLAVGLLLNTPGSGLIGGGGGICLLAGLSRVFRPGAMALTLAIGISPFPLAVWLAGDAGMLSWLPAYP